jgi:hypothetical protein
VLLADIKGRDRLWLYLDEHVDEDWSKLVELARFLPGRWRVPALFLVAWMYWRQGHGAMANAAMELLYALDPNYSAAQLLQHALREGINPRGISLSEVEAL